MKVKTVNIYLLFFLVVIFFTKFYSYLLFHTLVELFSIVIAFTIFFVSNVTKKYNDDFSFTFIGIAYLFVGILDIVHTISYAGMNIFTYQFHGNQVWVVTRFMEALSLLTFIILSSVKTTIKNNDKTEIITFVSFLIYSTIFLYSIYVSKIFPECFVKDKGQTLFKVISEIVICIILLTAILLLIFFKRKNGGQYFYCIFWSIFLTILSELSFTVYRDNYDILNAIGHYFKIFSFYLIYKVLIQYNLENPFDVIFKSLQEEKNKLAQSNKTKEKFISIIAHDLKNPIYGNKQLFDIITNKDNKITEEEKLNIFNLIKSSNEKIINLLENLLIWARSQSNMIQYNFLKQNLRKLINEEILLLESYTKDKQIKINNYVTEDIYAYFDYNSISFVIRNLLTNAIKFSYPGSEINIKYLIKGDFVELSVEDKGVGIKKEDLDKLFKIDIHFTGLGTKNEKGTGLGLIIVKEFITQNNGEIFVESEKGKGSIFTIKLPLEQPVN